MQNYDELHDAYAVSSYIHPDNPLITIYIQKLFPMDGSAVSYVFTAYDNSWRCLFTADSSVTFLIDGQSFSPALRTYSRRIRTFPVIRTAARNEFVLPEALISSISEAQDVYIVSSDNKIDYHLHPQEIAELRSIIAQDHY